MPFDCKTKTDKRRIYVMNAMSQLITVSKLLNNDTSQSQDASVKVDYCENHDDGRTKAIISCNKCGYLCTECDKYLHLSRKSKAHQRQVY